MTTPVGGLSALAGLLSGVCAIQAINSLLTLDDDSIAEKLLTAGVVRHYVQLLQQRQQQQPRDDDECVYTDVVDGLYLMTVHCVTTTSPSVSQSVLLMTAGVVRHYVQLLQQPRDDDECVYTDVVDGLYLMTVHCGKKVLDQYGCRDGLIVYVYFISK